MHITSTLFTLTTLLTTLTEASPLVRRDKTAASIIAEIMPSSNTCAGAQLAADCTTAADAAQPLIDAMVKYQLYAPGQIAAVLALIGFESVDMKFKHNVSPGRPGQGTSNMQMASFNREYAGDIPELAGPLASATSDDAVLTLLVDNKYNFGSGPWFLTKHCEKGVIDGLASGTDAAFAAYMGCEGVGVTDERKAYWTRAKTAFGL